MVAHQRRSEYFRSHIDNQLSSDIYINGIHNTNIFL